MRGLVVPVRVTEGDRDLLQTHTVGELCTAGETTDREPWYIFPEHRWMMEFVEDLRGILPGVLLQDPCTSGMQVRKLRHIQNPSIHDHPE